MRGDDAHTIERSVDRRAFLITAALGLIGTRLRAQSAITRPVVSEKACPLETIYPVAADGHRGLAVLRKPPGAGPFPVAIWFHGDITMRPLERLEEMARDLATGSRFLAAGYVFVAPTYCSRDIDPQTGESIDDAVAVVEHLRKLPFVDPQSIVVAGCSGGGDLALQAAARTNVAAVVAEEPASVLMSGVFHNKLPKKEERYTPADAMFLLEDGPRHLTPELRRTFRAKLAKVNAPIVIIQSDVDRREVPINRFNADVLIPELRASSRQFDVRTYPGQAHCFCSASGLPRPRGRAAPASWPEAALKAFQDIDAFCQRHVRTRPRALDPALITYEPVRTGPVLGEK